MTCSVDFCKTTDIQILFSITLFFTTSALIIFSGTWFTKFVLENLENKKDKKKQNDNIKIKLNNGKLIGELERTILFFGLLVGDWILFILVSAYKTII